jgi:hypothetical protein
VQAPLLLAQPWRRPDELWIWRMLICYSSRQLEEGRVSAPKKIASDQYWWSPLSASSITLFIFQTFFF